MEIEEIKAIPIGSYLDSKGIKPNKTKGNALYYCASWRGGDNPTNVRVDVKENIWYDYAEGVGGSIIELAMRIEKCTKAEALKMLSNAFSGVSLTPTTFSQQTSENKPNGIEITSVRDLFYFPLKKYMAERGISEGVACKYCKEVHYTFTGNGNKNYGVGFPLVSDGWVIRNKYFKGCTRQDISLIPVPGSTALMVFEGFIDFLSYVEMYGAPKVSVLVLNSVTNAKRAHAYFEAVERVYLLLDNDSKGREVTANILAIYGEKVVDKSAHFAPYKDFNEYLTKGGKNG